MIARFIAAAFIALSATAAQAKDIGPWQVGNSGYVIHVQTAQLDRPEDRARVLEAVETSARRLCEGVSPRRARLACMADVEEGAVHDAPVIRAALDKAKSERDGVRLAAR